jgi:hypothetical protein
LQLSAGVCARSLPEIFQVLWDLFRLFSDLEESKSHQLKSSLDLIRIFALQDFGHELSKL